MKQVKLAGIIPALATPLLPSGDIAVDEAGLRRLVDYLVRGGVHGLFATGSQGESFSLTADEKRRVWEIVVDEARGRVPVYAGTGDITTRESIRLTQTAEKVGVDAVSVITPSFISPSRDELIEHYRQIAASTHLPVLLYTNPARTGINLAPGMVAQLAKTENIVGIKDSSGDLTQATEYLRLCGSGFAVLVGRDTLIYALLQCGGQGAIAASATVAPRIAADIYDSFVAGDFGKAKAAQQRLAPLRMAFELGTLPVVIKEALALLGLCSARAIAPVGPLSEEKRKELRRVLVEMGLL